MDPPFEADLFDVGAVLEGLDGNAWIVNERYEWAPFQQEDVLEALGDQLVVISGGECDVPEALCDYDNLMDNMNLWVQKRIDLRYAPLSNNSHFYCKLMLEGRIIKWVTTSISGADKRLCPDLTDDIFEMYGNIHRSICNRCWRQVSGYELGEIHAGCGSGSERAAFIRPDVLLNNDPMIQRYLLLYDAFLVELENLNPMGCIREDLNCHCQNEQTEYFTEEIIEMVMRPN
jgi:hypothetical protein